MNGNSTYRVINFYNFIKEFNCKYQNDTGNQADEESTHRSDCIAAGSNGHQSGKSAV